MKEQRIFCVPDLQIPDHDLIALGNVLRFVRDWEPTTVICVGDDIDQPEPSAWNHGLAGEYAGTLQESFDLARAIWALFREAAPHADVHVSRSNHGDRLEKYLERYAPALADLRCLQLEELAGYRALDIEYHREPFEFGVPGWICCHGDEGGTSSIAGQTAGKLAQKFGVSVVAGHSHRLGLTYKTYSYGGKVTRSLGAVETGHLMSLPAATYLKGGSGDWAQGFAGLYESGGLVSPFVVPVHERGRFIVEGVLYGDNKKDGKQ